MQNISLRLLSQFYLGPFGVWFVLNYSFNREFKGGLYKNTIGVCAFVLRDNLKKLTIAIIEDFKMSDFQRDVFIGMMFLVGIFGFISGEFIVSTLVFASAAIFSNLATTKQRG